MDALLRNRLNRGPLKVKGINPTPLAVSGFINELTELRFKYDFEFLAYSGSTYPGQVNKEDNPL